MKTEIEPRAMILTPYYGGIDAQHMQCVQAMVRRGWLHGYVNGCGLVDHARAALAGMALRDEHGFEAVLWIDSDVVFSEYEAVKIVEACLELDAAVGAAVPIKKPLGPLMVVGLEPGTTLRFSDDAVPVEVLGIPFGFTAMPMHWLRTVCESVGPSSGPGGIEVWPAFACIRSDRNGTYMSEDYSFFQLMRNLGGKVYLDTRRRVGHKGSYVYTVEDSFWSMPGVESFEAQVTTTEERE